MNQRQFGLRTLMFLITVIAAFCGGWTANELNRQRQHRALGNQVSAEVESRLTPVLNDLRIASDKMARGAIMLNEKK